MRRHSPKHDLPFREVRCEGPRFLAIDEDATDRAIVGSGAADADLVAVQAADVGDDGRRGQVIDGVQEGREGDALDFSNSGLVAGEQGLLVIAQAVGLELLRFRAHYFGIPARAKVIVKIYRHAFVGVWDGAQDRRRG